MYLGSGMVVSRGRIQWPGLGAWACPKATRKFLLLHHAEKIILTRNATLRICIAYILVQSLSPFVSGVFVSFCLLGPVLSLLSLTVEQKRLRASQFQHNIDESPQSVSSIHYHGPYYP